eukprot:scaffold75251_cov34-Prasinocladus_malaysianus.AAC.3
MVMPSAKSHTYSLIVRRCTDNAEMTSTTLANDSEQGRQRVMNLPTYNACMASYTSKTRDSEQIL